MLSTTARRLPCLCTPIPVLTFLGGTLATAGDGKALNSEPTDNGQQDPMVRAEGLAQRLASMGG